MRDKIRHLSFEPIVDSNTQVLILGSLPGKKSLELSQYYGHPRNRIWKILSHITGNKISSDYKDKIKFLQTIHVGLWDVAKSAQDILQECLTNLANWLHTETGSSKLAYAGGVALITTKIIKRVRNALKLFVFIFLLTLSSKRIPVYSILRIPRPMKPIIKGKKVLIF